jgi:hypothetical protein
VCEKHKQELTDNVSTTNNSLPPCVWALRKVKATGAGGLSRDRIQTVKNVSPPFYCSRSKIGALSQNILSYKFSHTGRNKTWLHIHYSPITNATFTVLSKQTWSFLKWPITHQMRVL